MYKKCLSMVLAACLLSACGYHLGGVKPEQMKNMKTFCVDVFDNQTQVPAVAMQMTTALADAVQRDGTYRMVKRSEADFTINGVVKTIDRSAWSTDYVDAYHGLEIGVTVHVEYNVIDNRTGQVVFHSYASGQSSYFNDRGNVQTALESALSYATRRAAEDVVNGIANR